jgi:AraC-like DNA-binding protein/quercetin dioxygenase-like cupin family protein
MRAPQWPVPARIVFSPGGKYLVEFPPGFPVLLVRYDFNRPHATIPNYHDFLEITFIARGDGTFTIGGRDFTASAGDVFVINSGVFHLLESSDDNFSAIVLYFMPELIHQPGMGELDLDYLLLFLNYRQGFVPKIPVNRAQSGEVLRLLEIIKGELETERSFQKIAVKNCVCQILLILNRSAEGMKGEPGEMHLRLHDVNKLKPVFDHIQRHYSQKMTLAQMAKESGLSTTHPCRYFKKTTGKTITEYIKRFRVDKAKELLIEDERSITWIAFEVGFESHSYFDRIFHDLTRLTPQEFRKKFQPTVTMK